ncbi:MAG: hypothetical protein U0556_03300 [Dehalococcoidia bacterium]
MNHAGRAVLTLYDRPGFRLLAHIEARGAYLRVVLELNGAPVRTARRPTLTSSLRWAITLSGRVIEVFGQRPETIALDRAFRQASIQLAA